MIKYSKFIQREGMFMRKPKKGKVVTTCAALLVALCLHLFASGKTTQDCSAGDIDLSACYSSDNSKIEVLPDNLGGFYIVSANTTNTKLSYFDGNPVISSPTLDFKYISAASDGNYIYIFYSLGTEKKVKKYKYENGNFAGPKSELTANNWINFSAANNFVFSFVSAKNQKKDLVIYDPGEGINKVFENCNQFAVNSSKSKLYVQENDNNYLLAYNIDETGVSSEGEKIDPKNGNNDNLPDNLMHFLSDDILVTNTGKYFKLDSENSTIEHILSVDVSDLSVDFCSAVYKADSKNYIASLTSNNIVTFYDIDDSLTAKYKVELDAQDKIVSICTSGTKTILVWKNDTDVKAKILDKDDLTEIKNGTDPEPENPSDFEPVVKALNDTYTLSESECVYIPLSETISKVKDNLNLSGYNIEFKNYAGKVITSGKLGTGSVAIFSKDGKTSEFTFIVKGDVTGEGNANSRDVDCMYNHILGKSSLSEINSKAADINNDGVVDTLDLLLLSKMVSSSS